ncbi:cell envelope integrity protein TolA, partial [Escherichia coli]
MMNILHFTQSVKWSSWFIFSRLLHGLIFLAFIWRFSEVQPAMSPAPAIMLQWAEIIEAPSSPLSLPVGIAQQESAVTEEKQQTEDRQQRPVPEASDATIEIIRRKNYSVVKKKKKRPPLKIKAQTNASNPPPVPRNPPP